MKKYLILLIIPLIGFGQSTNEPGENIELVKNIETLSMVGFVSTRNNIDIKSIKDYFKKYKSISINEISVKQRFGKDIEKNKGGYSLSFLSDSNIFYGYSVEYLDDDTTFFELSKLDRIGGDSLCIYHKDRGIDTYLIDSTNRIIKTEDWVLDSEKHKLYKTQIFKYDSNGNNIEIISYDSIGILNGRTIQEFDSKNRILKRQKFYEMGGIGGKRVSGRTWRYDDENKEINSGGDTYFYNENLLITEKIEGKRGGDVYVYNYTENKLSEVKRTSFKSIVGFEPEHVTKYNYNDNNELISVYSYDYENNFGKVEERLYEIVKISYLKR